MGCINLFYRAKPSSQFRFRQLVNCNYIAKKIIHSALATLNLELKDLIYTAKWKLEIIYNLLKYNQGLIFWAEIFLRLDQFRQNINSAAGQNEHENDLLTNVTDNKQGNRIVSYFNPILPSLFRFGESPGGADLAPPSGFKCMTKKCNFS